MNEETFCAPATPPVNSSIAIIRINGPDALRTVRSIYNKPENIKPRIASYGSIYDDDTLVDDVVVLYYQGPHSFSGDDIIEIFCHGNQFIVHKLISLLNQRGIRLAEPGEFTRRAFLNGRMDLTEAEAVNHIITAKSSWEIDTALKQMHGSLGSIIQGLRDRLITLCADIEAGIDFIEEDIEFVSNQQTLELIENINDTIEDVLRRCRTGERVSHGIDVTITGKPNVGKSSLLNIILNTERAIVSDIPGTTRDMIRESVQIGGVHLNLVDTAGIDQPGDEIEKIGIELSHKHIESASLVLFVLDASTGIKEADKHILEKVQEKKVIYIINKVDIAEDAAIQEIERTIVGPGVHFSAKNGTGLKELEKAITGLMKSEFLDYDNSFIADIRVTGLLEKSLASMRNVKSLLEAQEPPEIIADEIRDGIDHLSEITGQISADDVLNSIFSRFCIGK